MLAADTATARIKLLRRAAVVATEVLHDDRAAAGASDGLHARLMTTVAAGAAT